MCPFPGCFYFEHGFQTQAALSSHQKATHQEDNTLTNNTDTGALSERDLDDLDDDDLSLVLSDAIVHSDLDAIRTLLGLRPSLTTVMLGKFYERAKRPRQELPNFDYSLCLAAWKSTTEVLRFLVDQNPSQVDQDKRLVHAFATAIETKNRDNIKYLLSLSLDLTQNIPLPLDFERLILNTQRVQDHTDCQFGAAKDIVSRSLSLWDPEFMDFLIDECRLFIPPDLKAPGGLFSQPAIRGLTLDQVRDRFEPMRKYLTDPRTFHDGVCYAVNSRSPHALLICLENHGSPNYISTGRVGFENALGVAYRRNNRPSLEMMRLLLAYGARPVLVSRTARQRTAVMDSFLRNEGISWDDFVQKAKSGEDLDMIIPKQEA